MEASLQHGSQLHQSEQVRRERERESKREVIVLYNLILEEISQHFLH